MSKARTRRLPTSGRPYMPGYDMMFDNRKRSLPWSWAQKRLSESRNYWVVSTRPDRRPHSMPVWGIWLNNSFFFCTGKFSRKSKNLEKSGSCVVCPDGTQEAVILEGSAKRCSEPSTLRRFATIYRRKYDYDIAKMLRETGDPVYTVQPRVVFGLVEGKKINGNPTRWLFETRDSDRPSLKPI